MAVSYIQFEYPIDAPKDIAFWVHQRGFLFEFEMWLPTLSLFRATHSQKLEVRNDLYEWTPSKLNGVYGLAARIIVPESNIAHVIDYELTLHSGDLKRLNLNTHKLMEVNALFTSTPTLNKISYD
jgi:hypothetical protein